VLRIIQVTARETITCIKAGMKNELKTICIEETIYKHLVYVVVKKRKTSAC